jgi:hypothetical protein
MKVLVNQVSGPPEEGVNSFVNMSIDLNVLVHSLVERIDTFGSNIKEGKRVQV